MSLPSIDSSEDVIEEMGFAHGAGDSFSTTMSGGGTNSTDYHTRAGPSVPNPFVSTISPQGTCIYSIYMMLTECYLSESLPNPFHQTAFQYAHSQNPSPFDSHSPGPLPYPYPYPQPSPSQSESTPSFLNESPASPFFHQIREMRRQGEMSKLQPSPLPPSAPPREDNASPEHNGETRTATSSGQDGHVYPRSSYRSDDVKTVYAI